MTQKKSNKKKTVQQKKRGPRVAKKTVTYVNGAKPRNVRNHLMDMIPRKSGLVSKNCQMACIQAINPMNATLPVMDKPTMEVQLDGAGTPFMSSFTIALTPGVISNTRRTFECVVGTQGIGCVYWLPEGASNVYAGDIATTTVAYTQSIVGWAGGVGWDRVPSSGAETTGQYVNHKLLGGKLTVMANEEAANSRAGKVIAVQGQDSINGQTISYIESLHGTQSHPSGLFEEGGQLSLRSKPTHNAVSVHNQWTANPLTAFLRGQHLAFVFVGTPGDTFSIQIETSMFSWGRGIPRSIAPVVDRAAIDCLLSCMLRMELDQVGISRESSGRAFSKFHKDTDEHTLMAAPAASVSGLWPIVKDLARTAGPALLKAIL
jgi:hypothetical protein